MRIIQLSVGLLVLTATSRVFASEPATAGDTTAPPSMAAPDTVNAPSSPDSDAKQAKTGLLLGVKVGGLLSFGGLSPNARIGVEVGYVFPWLKRGLAFTINADYAAPKSTGTQGGDPRVTGGSYDWHLTEQILTIMPTVTFRLTSLGKIVPYIGVGPRIYLLQSTVKGAVGASAIAETTERSTEVGIGVPLGVELRAGPGALTAEVLVEYGGLKHTATGSSNTGALSLLVGYRFMP